MKKVLFVVAVLFCFSNGFAESIAKLITFANSSREGNELITREVNDRRYNINLVKIAGGGRAYGYANRDSTLFLRVGFNEGDFDDYKNLFFICDVQWRLEYINEGYELAVRRGFVNEFERNVFACLFALIKGGTHLSFSSNAFSGNAPIKDMIELAWYDGALRGARDWYAQMRPGNVLPVIRANSRNAPW